MKLFSFSTSWIDWGLWVLLLLGPPATGYWAGDHNRNNAWLAKQAVAERQAREALQAEQVRGDALSTGLLHQQTQIDQLKTEKHEALTLVTTGRPCLGSPALRVLNTAPGITVRSLPPATSSAIAADGPFATDTDIASWVIDAGAAFEVCRARLDALIDWETP